MKKLFLTLTIALGVSGVSIAQGGVSLGVTGGVNFTTYQNEDLEDNKFAIGMNFAIPIEFHVHKNFTIQPELRFIQKGVAFDFTDTEPSFDLKVRSFTNYFELPIMLKGKFGNDIFKGYVSAGPTFGVALNRYQVTIIDDEREKESVDLDDSSPVKDNLFDMGASFGIGFELAAGPGSFVVDARYNMDFNDNTVFDDDDDEPANWNPTTNSGIGVSLGYVIHLGQ